MSWQHDPITDLDLMAYADGQLDAARRATVAAHLATAPEDAAMVEAIMAQNEALRRTLLPIAREAVPDRLKAVLERDRQPAWRPLLQGAAGAGEFRTRLDEVLRMALDRQAGKSIPLNAQGQQ